jgi:hypothetical protein
LYLPTSSRPAVPVVKCVGHAPRTEQCDGRAPPASARLAPGLR